MAHAALELALEDVILSDRFDGLGDLIRAEIGALVGDPGWTLERRGERDAWPPGTEFRACVDPDEFYLPDAEKFYTRAEFASLVLSKLNQYLSESHEQLTRVRRRRAEKRAALAPLLETLEKMARGE